MPRNFQVNQYKNQPRNQHPQYQQQPQYQHRPNSNNFNNFQPQLNNHDQGVPQNQVFQRNNQNLQNVPNITVPTNQNHIRIQGNVVVTTQHEGNFDWSNHEEDIADGIKRENVAFMAIIEKDTGSSSQVHYAPTIDLTEVINEIKMNVGKLESECFKKQSIINAYEASELVSEERMKSLKEDCVNSYKAQKRFTTEIDGLKKMIIEEKVLNTKLQADNEFLKNLVSTGNICGILNQVKEEDKYKAVPPPFNNNFMPKVDKDKRNAYLQQFKDVFQDKEELVDLYKNVEVSEEGVFFVKKELKEEKSIGVQVSKDDLESIDLNQDDLSDLSDQI